MMDKIKITIIYDNSLALSGLKHGFGFSCLLEFNDKYIIFDTGGDKSDFFGYFCPSPRKCKILR